MDECLVLLFCMSSYYKVAIRLFLCIILSTIRISAYSQEHCGKDESLLNKSLLELPAIHESDIILIYSGFVVKYNPDYLIPDWVAYELTAKEVNGEVPRASGFSMDLNYDGRQAMREDYSYSGWDKGHMAPSADMKWSQSSMFESFYLTNVCPQNHDLNGRDWHVLENRVRSWALKFGRVWVVCGPIVNEKQYGTIGDRNVMVPDGFFKAVLRQNSNGGYQAIAFVFKNDSSRQPLKESMISVDGLESIIGYDLFVNLDDDIEEKTESFTAWENWE